MCLTSSVIIIYNLSANAKKRGSSMQTSSNIGIQYTIQPTSALFYLKTPFLKHTLPLFERVAVRFDLVGHKS